MPPFAIVGGNPAKIIRYRFDASVIYGMQKIAWWDWKAAEREERKRDFALPPSEFVKKHLPEAEQRLSGVSAIPKTSERRIVLIIPDLTEKFPLYPKAFRQFFELNSTEHELLVYLPQSVSDARSIRLVEQELEKYESSDSYVTLQSGADIDEHVLFDYADFFVTTRDRQTVRRTCLCDLHHTGILYGTDEPIFPF